MPLTVEAAMTELRRLVREHLADELKKLKDSVDQQIKSSEDVIAKKLEAAEAATKPASPVKERKGK